MYFAVIIITSKLKLQYKNLVLYVIIVTGFMLAYCGHFWNVPQFRSEYVVTLDKAAML